MKKAIREIPKITGTVIKGFDCGTGEEEKDNTQKIRKANQKERRKKVICFENFSNVHNF